MFLAKYLSKSTDVFRCIVSHNVDQNVRAVKDRVNLKKGLISSKVFDELCRFHGREMEAENIKNYMLALGIAVETKDELIFVPALVSDENKVKHLLFYTNILSLIL